MTGAVGQRLVVALLLVVPLAAAGLSLSCSTSTASSVSVMPADLACASDQDCAIRQAQFGCCCDCGTGCPNGTAPFAISKRANAAWDAYCSGQECTALACDNPAQPQSDAFVAVCADRICELRPKR